MELIRKMTASLSRYIGRTMYRKMLLSYLLIISTIVTVLVLDFYTRTARDLKEDAIETNVRMTQQSALTLNAYLTNVRSFAWNYFGDFDFQRFVQQLGSDPETQSAYVGKFSNFVLNHPIVSSVIVSQLDGFSMRVGASLPNSVKEETERLQELAIAANGKGLWVSSRTNAIMSRSTVRTLTFVQALRSISLTSPGPVIGHMIFHLSPDTLRQWLTEVEGRGANRTYIVHADSGRIVLSLHEAEWGQQLLAEDELVRVDGSIRGHYYADKTGGHMLVTFERLEHTDWLLVSEAPVSLLTQAVDDFTKRTIGIVLVTLLFSMLLASFFSARTMTPLKELSKGMKAIESGNYSIHLPVRTQDEVGYLSSSFNRMTEEIDRLITKVYESELVKKNAEIKSLQSQINPHFLYNTLGIIDSLSTMHGDARVSQISRSLAKMFRYNISGNEISTMEAEIQQIRLYLSIQKIRFEHRLDYSIYVEPGLSEVPMPKLLFQPLVENSINHGISRMVEGGALRIEVTRGEHDHVIVEVWNNGQPIERERQRWLQAMLERGEPLIDTQQQRSSIGLSNVQDRIRLIYGRGCGLTFTSDEEYGTFFTITIRSTIPDEEAYDANSGAGR
ncbi:sensor histidine kinase [Paenibacillus sp. YYML68]|uniref:cache domain-containing sensor histidine kinase n=1 Tax=Paenibacillus sp. YYML68 TaxID=2909250 RepID=UPI002490E9FC|nr:sensor histidine kinase [Paenibacillus sp. YYML68]